MVFCMGLRMKEYVGKTLMLVENHYAKDPRVRSEAETLVKSGYKVIVIGLGEPGEKFKDSINDVTVFRIPTINLFKKSHKYVTGRLNMLLFRLRSCIGYIYEYVYFTLSCIVLSFYIMLKEGFDIVHAHNPPDTLFLVGGIHKIFRKKYVFDHHDLSPELYLSRFGVNDGIIFKLLHYVEQMNLKLADVVITTNESYKEIDIRRGNIKEEKVFVVRNGPDPSRVRDVQPDMQLKNLGKYILIYVGCMGPQDGVDYLLKSIYHMVYVIGRKDIYCLIVGKGDSTDDLKMLSKQLNIEEYVKFTGYIPDDDLIRYLSTADICLDPNPSNPLNDVSTWIKVMEYMAMGKPTVSFDLKETRFTAGEAAIYVPPNDVVEYAKAIVRLMDDPILRKRLGDYGREKIKKELNWDIVGKNLLIAYDYLYNKNTASSNSYKHKSF